MEVKRGLVTGRWQYAAGGGDSSAEDIDIAARSMYYAYGMRSWLTRGFGYSPEDSRFITTSVDVLMPLIRCSSTGSHSGRTCQRSPVNKRLRNPPPATLIIGLHACSLWIFFPLSNLLTDYLVFGKEGTCVT